MNEEIDSQLIAENVAFLDSCFDASFALQCSIDTVKTYMEQENSNQKVSKSKAINTQNKTLALDSTISKPSQNNVTNYGFGHRNLNMWGLPFEIVLRYQTKGITEMFEWQVQCLSNSNVLLECCNLVYSAPTSAGKTLVSEILAIKTILERQKKVILILPFVSIVREKMVYLQEILSGSGIRVEGFMGSQSPPGGLQSVHIAICTIEKANGLVNKLLDDGSIADLGAIIVDELHLLGDPHRGYILELLLTKVKYISSKIEEVQIQIIGMSATLPNLKVLANWLEAELFITQFRPIPLDEYCLVGNKLFDKCGNHFSSIKSSEDISLCDTVLNICFETIKENCSVLIFCMTKNRCESLAQNVASSFYKLGCSGGVSGNVIREQLKSDSISEVLEQLKNCPVGLDNVLKNVISFGVAYHHAGLTFDERDIIEGAFKSGAIRVLVATSTLSSGVNLPARKVIIRSPVFQKQPINILVYKQMIGRAGRMGKDTKGESILVCTEAEKNIGFGLMMGALEPVKSCIENEDKFMRAILEMVASEAACTIDELELYAKCTLLFTQEAEKLSQVTLLQNTLDQLKNYELIRTQDDDNVKKYFATSLGKACLSSSMAPNDGLTLFCEMQRARQCLVLETDLHLIYLVTPYSVSSQWGNIDWLHLLTLWESLTKAMKKVGELVGVQESFIIRCVRGNKVNDIQNKTAIHKRFYTALALQDLVNEVPLAEVASKFQCARGFLQSLQQAAATFAGMVTVFCHQLGWKNMEVLISQFQDRLHFGIHSELIDLMKLPSLNGLRARTLYNAGFETLANVASADINDLEKALLKSVPFQSERQRDDDDKSDIRKRNKIKTIWITGSCGMTTREASKNLIKEARQYLTRELGVSDINWNSLEQQNLEDEIDLASNIDTNNQDEKEIVVSNENLDGASHLNSSRTSENAESHESEITLVEQYNNVKTEINIEVKTENIIKDLTVNTLPINEETNSYVHCLKEADDDAKNLTKEDIVWDTLNFSDNEFNNISKNRISEKIFSPEVSFGDGEVKLNIKEESITQTTSVNTYKDISLFSSDGDNSSLFNDSLPVDLIPSKLLDDKKDYADIKQHDTAVEFNINTCSILNAFQSPIQNLDEEEDIKLFYDDDRASDSSPITKTATTKKDGNKENLCWKRQINETTNFDQPTPKKVKIEITPKSINNYSVNDFELVSGRSELSVIKTSQIELKCYNVKDEDVSKNIDKIWENKSASIYLYIEKVPKRNCNEVIGSKVLKPLNSKSCKVDQPSILKSISVYFGEGGVFTFDMSENQKLPYIVSKLSEWIKENAKNMKVFSFKQFCLKLRRHFNIEISIPCFDVCLAEWLINTDEKEPTLSQLMKKYCNVDLYSIPTKNISEELCVKAWAIWKIADKQRLDFSMHYKDIEKIFDMETQVAVILANCEYYGLRVDKSLMSQLLYDVKNTQEVIAKKAYTMYGHHFNFNSSKAVAKVLGLYRGKKVSTKKSVLTAHNTELSSLVIFWRKLNSILTRTLYPLTEKALIYSEGDRINPSYTMYTCTGRMSMHEPNLQNVPRTFSIPSKYVEENNHVSEDIIEFNCRNIFKASPGLILVSADYCQLEMRILTHYCRDDVLTTIMKSDLDVFKSIAASWGGVPEQEVDDDLRQRAKQLCYGIIYGMGSKTLGHMLDVSEMEAAVFMETFHKTYPNIKKFTSSVIDDCRKRGYIETLMKRRRYIPDIKSLRVAKKSTAERQAVNSTIQGSAADIAKAAMCEIYNRTHRLDEDKRPRLILQMHDELIYEVPETNKHNFITILKDVMENTVHLNVPLPVRVKTGLTWGTLN